MATVRTIGLLLCAALSHGCATAYDQRVDLKGKDEALLRPSRIMIEDLRSTPEKQTQLSSNAKSGSICARRYGDSYLSPSKEAYLVHLLASVSPESQTLDISLTKFETTEYCEASVERIRGAAIAGMTAAVTPVPMVVTHPAPENGDIFVLRVAGSVNGKDFDFARAFDYSDIHYTNFPSESAVYRRRIASAMEQIARAIVTLAARQNT